MSIIENINHWRETLTVGTEITSHTGELHKVTRVTFEICVLGKVSLPWTLVEQYFRTGVFDKKKIKYSKS